jgi:Zn finger protein HypA/HybF involved in hydrogenase expression
VADEPQFNCRCNWCRREFTTTNVITNICPDCRTAGHRAYTAALDKIKREAE